MIIARAVSEGGKQLLILGLSAENLRRLQQGDDMLLTTASHGEGIPEGWAISIFYGETEQGMTDQLRAMGVITPETKVKIDPRLKS